MVGVLSWNHDWFSLRLRISAFSAMVSIGLLIRTRANIGPMSIRTSLADIGSTSALNIGLTSARSRPSPPNRRHIADVGSTSARHRQICRLRPEVANLAPISARYEMLPGQTHLCLLDLHYIWHKVLLFSPGPGKSGAKLETATVVAALTWRISTSFWPAKIA